MSYIDPTKLSTDFISSYSVAYEFVENACRSHASYWKEIEKYERHIKGQKPKDPAKLKKMAQAWASNFNFNKARSKHEKATADNVSKAKDSIFLCSPQVRRRSKYPKGIEFLSNPVKRQIVSAAVARVLYEAFEIDSRFNQWINSIEYPALSYGYSCVIRDPLDWMGHPVHTKDIAFEDQTRPDEVKSFVVFENVKAIEFYSKWIETRNLKSKSSGDSELSKEEQEVEEIRDNGWSLEGLEELLYYAYGTPSERKNKKYEYWEHVLKEFNENPSGVVNNTQNITVAKIFYRNLDKTWTEAYIPYDNDFVSKKVSESWTKGFSGTVANEKTVGMIIYKKNHGRVSQKDLINIITDSGFSESQYIHDMRGLAKYSVPDSARYNRNRNAIYDKLIFSGSPMFVRPNSQMAEKFKIGVSSGFNMVEAGFSLLANQPQFDLNPHIAAIRLDENDYLRETSQYDPKIGSGLSSRPTTKEVQVKSAEVKASEQARNNVKLANYSDLMLSCLNWICDVPPPEKGDASYKSYNYFFNELEFHLKDITEEEIDKSVIKKIIKEIDYIRIDAYINDTQAIQGAIALAETPFGRNKLKRLLLLNMGMPRREINSMVPLNSTEDMGDMRVAFIENDMFITSNKVIFSASDDHIQHLEAHQGSTESLKQKVQAGEIDLASAFKILANSLPHHELHLAALNEDPTLDPGKFQEIHEENIRFLTQVRQAAERESAQRAKAQEEQRRNGGMTEEQRREAEFIAEERRKERAAITKDKRQEYLTVGRGQKAEMEHAEKMRRSREEFVQSMTIEEFKAEKEMNLELAKKAVKS